MIMTIGRFLTFLLLFLSLLASPAMAQFGADDGEPASTATLISEVSEAAPGTSFYAALTIRMKSGWHTYWKNPGDAGLPISLAWAQTPGVSVGDLLWPTPRPLPEGPLMTYGYLDEVTVPMRITVGPEVGVGSTLALQARADWLVCDRICIPQTTELKLNIPVAQQPVADAASGAIVARALNQQPKLITQHGQATWDEKIVNIAMPLSTLGIQGKQVTKAQFFAEAPNWLNYNAQQPLTQENGALKLMLTRSDSTAELPKALHGVLELQYADGGNDAFDIRTSQSVVATGVAPIRIILLAVLGGLILNLMPCVFPVLSLKALALSKHAVLHPRHARAEGLAYTAGVLLSFAVLALTLMALKAAGESIGWGFQMQSPTFVGVLAFLLFVVGLNLSGLFELPVLLGGVGTGIIKPGSLRGSFLTGILAVAVATPCTAPFMATALGYAVSAPPIAALAVFLALGFGLALPFLLLGFIPAAARFLPKPGAWMERFRGALAFPMYLSVVWLLWVLGQQAGPGSIALMLCSMIGILFALWLRRGGSYGMVRRIFVWLFLLAIPLMALSMLKPMVATATSALTEADETPYSAPALESLRANKRPVFLDATAAWCITCQVNKRVALSSARIKDEFKQRGITFMVADWTNENPEITQLLQSFGRSGVPMNVFFPAEGDPVILPQVLTESIVLGVISAR